MKKFNAIMILLVFVVQCYGETGDANFKDIWARKKLTGDWCGLRSDLADTSQLRPRLLLAWIPAYSISRASRKRQLRPYDLRNNQ